MSFEPFVLVSDLHLHNFTLFDTPTEQGHGRRVEIALEALRHAAYNARTVDIKRIVIAGDVFHKRGSITPSVVNPFRDLLEWLIKNGFTIEMIPGNHDLETATSREHSSAIQFLRNEGVRVFPRVDDHDGVLFIPWIPELPELKAILEATPDHMRADTMVVMHAPINGVLPGLPETGLDPAWLKTLGYKAIFSGHYHNHVDFGEHVYSIGALTHQNFGDVDTQAGYMVVKPDGDGVAVSQNETGAPMFVDFSMDEPDDAYMDGNYVRSVLIDSALSARQSWREDLIKRGALDAVVHDHKSAPSYRGSVAKKAVASAGGIREVAKFYIDEKYKDDENPVHAERVFKGVEALITQAEEAAS